MITRAQQGGKNAMAKFARGSRWAALGGVAAVSLLLSSCGSVIKADYTGGLHNYIELETAASEDTGFSQEVAGNGLSLKLNEATGEISLTDTRSGSVWYSNPPSLFQEANLTEDNQQKMRSQVLLTFQNERNEISTYYSSRDSVELGNFAWAREKHGFLVTYQMGEVDIQEGLPKALTAARFEELSAKFSEESDRKNFERRYSLLQFSMLQDEEQRTEYLKKYPLLKTQDIYILRTANATLFRKLRAQLKEIGYTEEDLRRDHEAAGLPAEETRAVFQVALRYALDGDQLVVTVPRDMLGMPAGYIITDIAVLPFLGAEGKNASGHILLPDGSGSLLRMNNGKTTANVYECPVYGEDIANYDSTKRFDLRTIHMPYFGILGEKNGLFAVLEDGKANAVIHAGIAGGESVCNAAYASFYPLAREAYQLGSQSNAHVYFYEKQFIKSDMSIRYYLFPEPVNYSRMAHVYQQYLVERDMLLEKQDDALPAYIKLTGAVTDTGSVLGIQYDKMLPLTTFSQAEQILQMLQKGGVSELAVQYVGWNSGGVSQGLPDRLRPESRLDGRKGFQQLTSYCRESNIPVFLRWDYQLVTKENSLFDNFVKSKHAALTVTGKEGYYTAKYRPDTFIPMEWNYVLAPSLYPTFSQTILRGMETYDVGGADVHYLASKLAADYTSSRYTSRTDSIGYVREAMQTLTGAGKRILAENVSDYSLAYVTDVVPLDTSSAEYAITDEAVPFLQLVIGGRIRYAGAALNYEDPRIGLLKALETGSLLYGDFIFADSSVLANKPQLDSYYTAHYASWTTVFCQAYQDLAAAYRQVGGRELLSHTRIRHDLILAAYPDGGILINYSDQPQVYNGVAVAAQSYTILESVDR